MAPRNRLMILIKHPAEDNVELLGFFAGILTLSTYVPQAYKTLRTQKTRDLSLATLCLLSLSAILWVIYGLLGDLPAVWITNTVVSILGLLILATKVKNELKT